MAVSHKRALFSRFRHNSLTPISAASAHVVTSARRYEPFVPQLVRELDDPTTSMAETCRRVADRVQELGCTRPSLVHLRTFVRAERDRKDAERQRDEALAEIIRDVTASSLAGCIPEPRWVLERIEQATGTIWR